jgi:hypothetical protein
VYDAITVAQQLSQSGGLHGDISQILSYQLNRRSQRAEMSESEITEIERPDFVTTRQ